MLSYALPATSAEASGPLGGQPIAVPAAPAVVQQAAAPVVRTARTTVAKARETAERAAAAPAISPVADAPAAVESTVTAVHGTVAKAAPKPSPKPAAAHRHPVRHRRGGATVARAASAIPAHTAKRSANQRTAVATPALPVTVAVVSEHSAAPQTTAPHRAPRTGSVAPVQAPEPVPATTSSTTATGSGSTAGSAAAVLALLALLTLAFPRLGALLRLPKGWAPMPPLLALPERPG
jgi:hypothetical protein